MIDANACSVLGASFLLAVSCHTSHWMGFYLLVMTLMNLFPPYKNNRFSWTWDEGWALWWRMRFKLMLGIIFILNKETNKTENRKRNKNKQSCQTWSSNQRCLITHWIFDHRNELNLCHLACKEQWTLMSSQILLNGFLGPRSLHQCILMMSSLSTVSVLLINLGICLKSDKLKQEICLSE